MASQAPATNGAAANDFTVKAGLAQMLKGGVIMDVVNAEQVYIHNIRQLTEALTQDLRPALLKKPVPPLSWPLSVSLPTFAPKEVSPACPTPR